MREELIAAIRNALERGQTIEQAVRSLINAGYHSNDVSEAAGTFSGVSNVVSPQVRPIEVHNDSNPGTNVPIPVVATEPHEPIYPQKKSGKGWIIFLVAILLLLVGVLVASMFFKDQILTWVNSLGV